MPNNQSASGTTLPSTINFAGRYNYVAVTNLDATAVLYASTIDTTPGSDTDNTVVIAPGETRLLSNGDPTWSQAARVIAKGTLVGGTPGTPAEVQPYGSSLYGTTATPGINVYLTGTGTGGWSVEGTG